MWGACRGGQSRPCGEGGRRDLCDPGGVGRQFGEGRRGRRSLDGEGVVGVVGVEGDGGPSRTRPKRGGGMPGAPGRWRGGAWRGRNCSFSVPGRRGKGLPLVEVALPVLAPSGRRLAGGCGRTRSIGTKTPPTITADVGERGKSLGGAGGGWGKGGAIAGGATEGGGG